MAKEFAKAFYKSKAWQRCRNAYVAERVNIDGGLCEACHERPGEELHHIKEIDIFNVRNSEITLNHNNLMWLCKECHFAEHKQRIVESIEKRRKKRILGPGGIWFDDSGNPQPQKIFIVYGAPASGKTSYVQENKHYGDLVVDLDLIKSALTMCQRRETPDNILNIAIEVRNKIYDLIKQKKVDCKAIWIIASLPKKKDRETIAKELNGELIFLRTDFNECINRAMSDTDRGNAVLQEHIIKKWFEEYEE